MKKKPSEVAFNTKENIEKFVSVAVGECVDAHGTSLTMPHLFVCCLATGKMGFFFFVTWVFRTTGCSLYTSSQFPSVFFSVTRFKGIFRRAALLILYFTPNNQFGFLF